MLVLPCAIDDVFEVGNDDILDTGDAEMDGPSVDSSMGGAGFRKGVSDAGNEGGGVSDGGQYIAADVELIGYHPAIDMLEGSGL